MSLFTIAFIYSTKNHKHSILAEQLSKIQHIYDAAITNRVLDQYLKPEKLAMEKLSINYIESMD